MKDIDVVFNEGWEKKEPDFVNEEGTKWWIDEDMNEYIKSVEEQKEVKLNIIGWFVERKDGYRTRILIEKDKPIYESQKMEFVAAFIDVRAVSEEFNNGNIEANKWKKV